MTTITNVIEQAFLDTFAKLNLGSEIMLTEATKAEFGDFQVNGVMKAAKLQKTNPRELALAIIANVNLTAIAEKLEVAGPGFINIFLKNDYLSSYLSKLNNDNKFGVNYLEKKAENVVVDLSSPNLAKEMHVGHLRSTVIGESLALMFEYMGDIVVRQNHVGDWGTQFGMLIAYLDEMVLKDGDNPDNFKHKLSDLEKFYRASKLKFDQDEAFAEKARQFVVILQNYQAIMNKDYSFQGWDNIADNIKFECENNNLAERVFDYWKSFRKISLEHCQVIYDELNVPLNSSDNCARGESWYNDRLVKVINSLNKQHMLEESNGAKCIFFASGEISNNEEEPPLIVQKNDGGFLYATTDLAAVDFRSHDIEFITKDNKTTKGANRVVYVVDARQALHFKQVFLAAKKAGFATLDMKLEHAQFGTMMNEDGTPFKTRDGGVIKLIDLIGEAKTRALNIVNSRNPEWNDKEKESLADILAIGAIKYSDLSKNRASDYIFSFDKMLAFDGNTAPYLLYAYTRIQSILKKSSENGLTISDDINLLEYSEHKLGLHLAKFADMLLIACRENYPHYVAQYLYNLAGLFMQFYETCPILKNDDIVIQSNRLALANLTASVLKTGLEKLLGITVTNRM